MRQIAESESEADSNTLAEGSTEPLVAEGSEGPRVAEGSEGPLVAEGSEGPRVAEGSEGPSLVPDALCDVLLMCAVPASASVCYGRHTSAHHSRQPTRHCIIPACHGRDRR